MGPLPILAHHRCVQADQRLTLRAGCLPRPRARSERDSGISGFEASNPDGPWPLRFCVALRGEEGQFADGRSITTKARVFR